MRLRRTCRRRRVRVRPKARDNPPGVASEDSDKGEFSGENRFRSGAGTSKIRGALLSLLLSRENSIRSRGIVGHATRHTTFVYLFEKSNGVPRKVHASHPFDLNTSTLFRHLSLTSVLPTLLSHTVDNLFIIYIFPIYSGVPEKTIFIWYFSFCNYFGVLKLQYSAISDHL